jgi:hypothetical protein
MQQSVYQMIPVLRSMAMHYKQGANMNTDKGNAAESTNDKGYGMGSTAGIPASMPIGGEPVVKSGSKATFSGGKKSVSK